MTPLAPISYSASYEELSQLDSKLGTPGPSARTDGTPGPSARTDGTPGPSARIDILPVHSASSERLAAFCARFFAMTTIL